MENADLLYLVVQALLSGGVIWKGVNFLKDQFGLPRKYAPIIAILLGVACGLVLATWLSGSTALEGIVLGLAFAGFTITGYDVHRGLKS